MSHIVNTTQCPIITRGFAPLGANKDMLVRYNMLQILPPVDCKVVYEGWRVLCYGQAQNDRRELLGVAELQLQQQLHAVRVCNVCEQLVVELVPCT